MENKIDCTRCANFDPEKTNEFSNQIIHCDKNHRVIFRPKLNGYYRSKCEDFKL